MAKKIEKYLPVDYSDSFSIEVCNKGLFSQTFRYRN